MTIFWKNFKIALGLGILILITSFIFNIPKVPKQNWPEEKTPTLEDWQSKYPELIKQFVIESKPTDIPPRLHPPGITDIGQNQFPEDGWFVGFKTEVINGPTNVLHHMDVINTSSSSLCNNRPPEYFVTAVKEHSTGALPLGFGYLIKNGDLIINSLMFHNMNYTAYKGVIARLIIFYIPKNKIKLVSTKPLLIDILKTCELQMSFYIPPRQKELKTVRNIFTMKKDGQIIAIGPHLHDFGKSISLLINNIIIKKISSEITPDGELISLPVIYPKNLFVKKRDVLGLAMEYDNISDTEVDVMAKMVLYLTE